MSFKILGKFKISILYKNCYTTQELKFNLFMIQHNKHPLKRGSRRACFFYFFLFQKLDCTNTKSTSWTRNVDCNEICHFLTLYSKIRICVISHAIGTNPSVITFCSTALHTFSIQMCCIYTEQNKTFFELSTSALYKWIKQKKTHFTQLLLSNAKGFFCKKNIFLSSDFWVRQSSYA